MRVGGQTLARVATLINSHPRLTGALLKLSAGKGNYKCGLTQKTFAKSLKTFPDIMLKRIYYQTIKCHCCDVNNNFLTASNIFIVQDCGKDTWVFTHQPRIFVAGFRFARSKTGRYQW